jgi:hypothetical protein
MITPFAARLFRATALAVATLAALPVLADAILVAPHALFITHDQGTGEVYLVNQDDVAEEVSVELRYGYPATDSLGNIGIRFVDSPGPDDPSAAGWMRAFPRRARVEPGRRQRVRIQASPPADLLDGEYWARLVVTSRAVQDSTPAVVDTAVRAGITIELKTITSVTYRKGEINTGVALDDLGATVLGDSLEVWVDLHREGNAAFLGTVSFALLDPGEEEVISWATPIAVYFEQHRRFVFPLQGVAPGYYQLQVLLSTDREDIDAQYVLPAAPVERTVSVTIG